VTNTHLRTVASGGVQESSSRPQDVFFINMKLKVNYYVPEVP